MKDYSGETHNFGIGLPGEKKNGDRYEFIVPMLADVSMRPTKAQIRAATANFCQLLSIRRSTPLLRLQTTHEIQRRMKFYNRGPAQVPGLIIASINDGDASTPGLEKLDSNYKRIVLVFNATPHAISHGELDLTVDFAGVDLAPLSCCSQSYRTPFQSFELNSETHLLFFWPRVSRAAFL